VSDLGTAWVAQLDADDLAALAARLAPYLPTSSEPAPVEPLLTVAQAAARASMCAETVRRAVRSGALPAARAGRSLRVRPDDLDAWLRRSERPQTAPQTPVRRARSRAKRRPLGAALAALDRPATS
jgi:excisionase family DNA binding protein